MAQIDELQVLLKEVELTPASMVKQRFTELFVKGCELLELTDDASIAVAFETSHPTASRWRRGLVVPPGAVLVFMVLSDLIKDRLKQLGKREE